VRGRRATREHAQVSIRFLVCTPFCDLYAYLSSSGHVECAPDCVHELLVYSTVHSIVYYLRVASCRWLWGGDRATVVPGVLIRAPPTPKDSALPAPPTSSTVTTTTGNTTAGTTTGSVSTSGSTVPPAAPVVAVSAAVVETVPSVPTSPSTLATSAATFDS
jgi:hypothetical protein